MMKSYYLSTSGTLRRKENTLLFETESKSINIPVETVYAIYASSPVNVSGGAFVLLSKMGIPVHMFGHYGNYLGTYVPKKQRVSGDVTVKQCSLYLDNEKRMFLARRFVEGSIRNMLVNISRYGADNAEMLEKPLESIDDTKTIGELMGIEAMARKEYYRAMDSILPEEFAISERSRRPPRNMGNAMISYSNSLVYAAVVTEIFHTPLNPAVSFLHEPMERRYSLSLDVSEIFKPLIADRLVVFLTKKRIIRPEHFDDIGEGVFLNNKGNKIFLRYFSERMKKTIKHRKLGRKVSYRKLIRLELYKLVKHIIGIEEYRPFVIWW